MDACIAGHYFLVTGASGGIGAAIARSLAAEGAIPILHTHRHIDVAHQLAASLTETAPVRPPVIAADLRCPEATRSMWQTILKLCPRVDGIIANAGVWPPEPQPLHRIPESRWTETLAVNVYGVFHSVRGFFEHLEAVPRPQASVVLIASTAAMFGEAGHADYAASKAAIAYGLTPTLKNEIITLSPGGRVNCICPGWTQTPMAAASLESSDQLDEALATVSLHKVATPIDIAQAAVFLSSSHLSGHISGSILPIHGGMEGRVLHNTNKDRRSFGA